MLLRNIDISSGLCNGRYSKFEEIKDPSFSFACKIGFIFYVCSRGVIIEFAATPGFARPLPVVRFMDGHQQVIVVSGAKRSCITMF